MTEPLSAVEATESDCPFNLTRFPSLFASGQASPCVMFCDKRRSQSLSLLSLILDNERLEWVRAQPLHYIALLIGTDLNIALMRTLEDEQAVIEARERVFFCELRGGDPTDIALELDPALAQRVAQTVSRYCGSGGHG